MDERLDLDAVRLLSLWMSARRDLSAHLDLLTAFGPHAVHQVERNLALIDQLQEKAYAAWVAYRTYTVEQARDRHWP